MGRTPLMSWLGGPGTRLGEQLAHARELAEAAAIVRSAVCALGVPACEIGKPATHEGGISIPVLGPRGVVATLSCDGPVSRACERELVLIAMHLSVWWTNRGIGSAPRNESLTPRQLQIAQLAASGATNAEIADALGISINTVKARLKEVFERLGIDNRTELASVPLAQGPVAGEPPG